MELTMDWILNFVSKTNPTAQINILKNYKKREADIDVIFLSVEIFNIDKMYEKAKENNYAIAYKIKNEPWGLRRFFVEDSNGATINLLTHNDN